MVRLAERIHQLRDDNKQAVYVTNQLADLAFAATPVHIETAAIAKRLDELSAEAGLDLPRLSAIDGWESATLSRERSGQIARELLLAVAELPGGANLVELTLDKFEGKDETAAFDPLSLAVGASVLYLALSLEIDGEVFGVRIKKAGMNPAQQIELVKATLPKLIEAAIKAVKGG